MISRPEPRQTDSNALPGGAPQDQLGDLPSLIAQIVETMRKGNLESLEVSRGDFYLSLKSRGRDSTTTNRPATLGQNAVASVEDDEEQAGDSEQAHTISSPMIGTFYVAPAPGEPPFIQPGDVIEQDQVIGIVEAMKIMNEIASDRAGRVIEVVAQDGQTVEYGSPLVRLALDD